ncbi:MAG: hypothetical protein ACP6IY_08350 [Promethearchaeia archaeon]
MLRRKKFFIICSLLLMFCVLTSFLVNVNTKYYIEQKNVLEPKISATLEGSNNIIITKINREANISGYGLVNIIDNLDIKNLNSNPISAIYIGIPINESDNLIFYEALGKDDNTLSVERNDIVYNDYELISIYFETPLQPQTTISIKFKQVYKDMLTYSGSNTDQQINFKGYVYPALPYRAEGDIKATFLIPESSNVISSGSWSKKEENEIIYDLGSLGKTYIDPFFENFESKDYIINIVLSDTEVSYLEFEEITRTVQISPWGIIHVEENFMIKNHGVIDVNTLNLKIPGPAKMVKVYDDLGEILGTTIYPESNYSNLKHKDLTIDLSENRVKITPNTKFKFSISYFLPFEKYVKIDWFRESIKLDLILTTSQYLGKDQTIQVEIDGVFSLDSYTENPDSITYKNERIVLTYTSDYVTPLDKKEVVFTFTIDIFKMIFRPIGFMILIMILTSIYVYIVKTKKREEEISILKREMIPVNEIRQFCSLYEEKNALYLEIRQAEEDAKRKKIVKKKLKSIINNNTQKIQEIEQELIPFIKALKDAGPTFANFMKRFETLEAERISVQDGLKILETRYKRGRLPSKDAYLNLSRDFLRRQQKIDRSIDKLIQQLRSYLL